MAIDTQSLRSAALRNSGRGLPFPDGTIDQGDRMVLLGQYNSMASVVPAGDATAYIPNWGVSYNPPQYSPQRWKPPRYKKPW